MNSRLGGVVVSVLATGPKGCGFEPGHGDGFFKGDKIRSTPFFEWEVKPEVPCRKSLRHVKDVLKLHGDGQTILISFAHLPFAPEMSQMARNRTVLVAARDVSAGRKPVSTGGCNRDVSVDRTAGQHLGLPERCNRQVTS
jgi:hypothetical protein